MKANNPDNLEGRIFKQRNDPFSKEARQQNDLRFAHLMSRPMEMEWGPLLPRTYHAIEKGKRAINLPSGIEESLIEEYKKTKVRKVGFVKQGNLFASYETLPVSVLK